MLETFIKKNYTFKEGEEIIAFLKGHRIFDKINRIIIEQQREIVNLKDQVENYRIDV